MIRKTFGSLDCVLTGGSDRQGGGTGPLVVLLHGFGAPGTDLVGLWRVLNVPPETRFLFPAAPHALDFGFGDSRAWWMIDMVAYERAVRTGAVRDLSKTVPDGLAEARAMVVEMLEAAEAALQPSAVVLGGFSQGAMLSMDVALHTDRPLAGLIQFSGTLLAEHEWVPRMAARGGTRVVQSHGTRDPILPFALAEALRDHLTAAAWVHRWVPFPGQHEIPDAALEAASALIRGHAGPKTDA